jgi:16S rRNA (adenine1518-N6/adenine1519-N6)-dimethyltransferase
MIEILNDRISNNDFDLENIDFNINRKDILKYEPENKDYSVIANIPYYITSPILRHFLYDVENKPDEMVILMQKEVAEKIMLNFKNKSSVLSLMIEKKSDVSYEQDVLKDFFVPAPKIDSAVLLFKYNNKFNEIDDDKFLKLIKI